MKEEKDPLKPHYKESYYLNNYRIFRVMIFFHFTFFYGGKEVFEIEILMNLHDFRFPVSGNHNF